ncbi:MAG: hypothetical protein R3F44_14800 [Candidatus Competibacteraceae bacterium]
MKPAPPPPLIRALLDRYPDRPLLVTTTTLTGSRQSPRGAGRTPLPARLRALHLICPARPGDFAARPARRR